MAASLHAACAASALADVQRMLKNGADMNAVNENGETPIVIAVKSASVDVIGVLMGSGASVNAADERGNTLLHLACLRGDVQVVKLLLEMELNVEAENRAGRTPLHVAVEHSLLEVVRCLIDRGGSDLKTVDSREWSLLRLAIEIDRLEAVEYLIDAGADVFELDSIERSLLHIAVEKAGLGIVKLLVEHGVDVNAMDENERSVLHSATASGRAEIVDYLLEQGAEVDVTNGFGRTPLFMAVINDYLDVTRSLVDHGADLTTVDSVLHLVYLNGKTISRCAIAYASAPLVEYLESTGVDFAALDENGDSALRFAVERGDVAIIDSIAQRGLPLTHVNNDKKTLLHFALEQSNQDVVKYLVEKGVDVNARDKDMSAPLHIAADQGDQTMIQYLIDHGASIDVADAEGRSPVFYAIAGFHMDVAKLLFDKGADVNGTTSDGISHLSMAVLKEGPELVQYLIDHGADINCSDERGQRALHDVSLLAIAQILVDHGAIVNASDEGGKSPLHAAVGRSPIEVVDYLLSVGAQPNAQDNEGNTPLQNALWNANMDEIELLVKKGADVNLADNFLRSPLRNAIESSKPHMIEKMVRFFVRHGADVNAVAKDGKTPLHRLCAFGEKFNDLVSFMLENGAKESMRLEDADGYCPLHIAVQDLNISLTKILLDRGADINLKNREGQTPLEIAVFNRNRGGASPFTRASMVYALCSRGATWNASCEECLDDLIENRDEYDADLLWTQGIKGCALVWEQECRDGQEQLTPIPLEVIQRGEESVRIFSGDVKAGGEESLIYRRKICVVGPSEWGKTSLVKSLTSMTPSLVAKDDRTIGIDLFSTDFVARETQHHELTFWDFAGQDVYQVAHSLFFSRRTLYLLCVDLEEYSRLLKECETLSLRQAETTMSRFMAQRIFRWIRLNFVRQPDGEFVVIGTKSDRIEDAEESAALIRDLTLRIAEWKRRFVEEIQEASRLTQIVDVKDVPEDRSAPYLIGGQSARRSALQDLAEKAKHIASSQVITVSSVTLDEVIRARRLLEYYVVAGQNSFIMPQTYTKVLDIIRQRREKAARMESRKDRIENTVVPFRALCSILMRQIDGLQYGECVAIVRTLHDLGDVLWYEREGSGALKDVVIIDPMLVLDFVREVVNHEMESQASTRDREGCVQHAVLRTRPFWCDTDQELTHAFKLLLQYFQLAYPADNKDMDWDSDLIIPAYWKARKAATSKRSLLQQKSMMSRHGLLAHEPLCWEYELSGEVSETVFEQFAVESHTTLFDRTISPRCIDSVVRGDFASHIELIQQDSARDVIRIEVTVRNQEAVWQYMRFYVMAMEKVLDEYPGLVASRYLVEGAKRHRIANAVKALEDAAFMGKNEDSLRALMPWLPPDFGWFTQKAWRRPGALQELRMKELVREAVDKVDVLRKLVVADDTQRQYPALWAIQYDANVKKLEFRMLSDLSGQCFHDPITIDVPPAFLSKHGGILQAGISILSNVVPEVVSLGILSNVIELVTPVVDSKVDNAKVVHNLIDKLELAGSTTSGSDPSTKLSPKGSAALLREVLLLHDPAFDELSLPDLAQLQCAASTNGRYVWAHRQEIMAMGDKLTPCDPVATSPTPEPMVEPSPQASPPVESKPRFKLSIESVEGLSEWDWRKVYCEWRLEHPSRSTPIGAGVTFQHSDYAHSPTWASDAVSLEGAPSLEMLRESQLVVRVKRPSRCLGVIKTIGEGNVTVGVFVGPDGTTVDGVSLEISLRASGSSKHVVKCRILSN